MNKTSRSRRGSNLAEAAVAAIVLVPITLCLLDLLVMVSAYSMNDTAAKNCARAAANQADQPTAGDAAANSLSTFRSSSIVRDIQMDMQYTLEKVTVITTMKVHLPVPWPGYDNLVFKAQDVEPVMTSK